MFESFIAEKLPWLKDDEEKEKVLTFVEVMLLLDVSISILDNVDVKVVQQSFRRKSLQCHPDKFPNANHRQRSV